MKLVGNAEVLVISKFLEIGMKGTFFSQVYLKYNFFSLNLRVGLMNSPSTVVVYN